MAFVEPPTAMSATIALSKLAAVRKRDGRRSAHTFSTICRPLCAAMRQCSMSFAGMDDAPGSVSPSVSAIAVIVLAVPIVMQWPCDRAMPASISHHSSSVRLPARFSAQYFHASEPEPSVAPRQLPRSIGPPGTKMNGSPADSAPMMSAGVVLSHAPSSTAPSAGWQRSTSSVSIARRLR